MNPMAKLTLLSPIQFLWPLQRFKDSKGQHMLHEEALKYGMDLEPKHYEQDEPMGTRTKELHTEAGPIRTDIDSDTKGQAEDIPPHMPHARWETAAVATTTPVPSLESDGFIYTWQLGEWSKCSQECGAAGSGLQVSALQVVGRIYSD